jgi:hypothetical protein
VDAIGAPIEIFLPPRRIQITGEGRYRAADQAVRIGIRPLNMNQPFHRYEPRGGARQPVRRIFLEPAEGKTTVGHYTEIVEFNDQEELVRLAHLEGAINPEAYQDPTEDAEITRIEDLAARYEIGRRTDEEGLRRRLGQAFQRLEETDTTPDQLRQNLENARAEINNGIAWLLFNEEEQARFIQMYTDANARLNEIGYKEAEDIPAVPPMPVIPAIPPQSAETDQENLIRQLREAVENANDGDVINNIDELPPVQVIDALGINAQPHRMLRIATPTALNDEIAAREDAALLCPVWGTIRDPNNGEILNILREHGILNRTEDNRGINPDPDGEDARYWQEYVNFTRETIEIYIQQEGRLPVDLENPQIRYTPEGTVANRVVRRLYFETPQLGHVGHFTLMIDPNDQDNLNDLRTFIDLVRGHQVLIQRNAYQASTVASSSATTPASKSDAPVVPPMTTDVVTISTPPPAGTSATSLPTKGKRQPLLFLSQPQGQTKQEFCHRDMIRQEIESYFKIKKILLDITIPTLKRDRLIPENDADFGVFAEFVDIILYRKDILQKAFLDIRFKSMPLNEQFKFIARGYEHAMSNHHIGTIYDNAYAKFQSKVKDFCNRLKDNARIMPPIHDYTTTHWKDMPQFTKEARVIKQLPGIFIPFAENKTISMARFTVEDKIISHKFYEAKGLILIIVGELRFAKSLIMPY